MDNLDVLSEVALLVELLATGAALEVPPTDATMLPSVVGQHLLVAGVVLATPGTLGLSAWLPWMRKVLGDAVLHHGVLGSEGQEAAEWLLVDLVDVVVHIMLPRAREFYEIEKLWDISLCDDDADRGNLGVQ